MAGSALLLLLKRRVLDCRIPLDVHSKSPIRIRMHMRGVQELDGAGPATSESARTLVIYTFSNTDVEYFRNLEYFVQTGMWEKDGCDYVIIVQQVGATLSKNTFCPQEPTQLPALGQPEVCSHWKPCLSTS